MEINYGRYIHKKNTYQSGWGGKIAKFGPKIAFLAVLEPQDTIFSLFCTFWWMEIKCRRYIRQNIT